MQWANPIRCLNESRACAEEFSLQTKTRLMSIRTITKIALMLAVAGSLALPASAQESVDPYTYMSRGKAYVRSGEYKKAISDFNKAIEIDPDNALFYRNRSGAINEALRTEGIHPVVRLEPLEAKIIIRAKGPIGKSR